MRVVLISLILFFSFALTAHAGALTLSDARYAFEGGAGRISSDVLVVRNDSTGQQQYQLFVDPEIRDSVVALEPRSFLLLPGEERAVVLRFRQPEESISSSIKLVAMGEKTAAGLTVGNGITIPVQFIVPRVAGASAVVSLNSYHMSPATAVYALDFLLIVLAVWFIRSRQSHNLYTRDRHKINFI